jgi:hypothetical protein
LLKLSKFLPLSCLLLALHFLLGACIAAPLSGPPATLPPPVETLTPTPAQTSTPTPIWFPPTATFTPFPTQVITPTQDLRPQVGELILSDSFDDPDLDARETASASIALGKNELSLALTEPDGYLYSLRNDTRLGDFYLEITASPGLCKGSDEYGLLLRVSKALDFYRFGLTCDGQARLDKYVQGKASSPQPPTPSGAVPRGAPSESRLGVWAQGKELRFFVNGEYQFTLSDPALVSGGLGVYARSSGNTAVTISFSDLIVYEAAGSYQ